MEMLARKLRTLRAERVVKVQEVHPPRRPPTGAEPQLSRGWAFGLPIAWAVIFSSAAAVEPPPAHPNAPEPLIGVLLGMALFSAWTVMVVGLAGRRAIGAWGSLAAGGTFLAAAIACPVSGHHSSVGLWWFYELAGAATLIALSLRAIPRER